MKELTREEFYTKYGDIEVTFSHYYKFTFTYKATLSNGFTLTCMYGGNSDEIYKFSLTNNEKVLLKDLQPHTGSVYNYENVEVDGFYDY